MARVAASRGWKSITIDSDPAHVARSAAIARRLGFDAHTNPTKGGDGSAITSAYLARETSAYLAFEVWQQWNLDRVIE